MTKKLITILLCFVMLFANINVKAEKGEYTEALKSGVSEYSELWSFAKDNFPTDIELVDEENIVCVETFTSMERVRDDRAISVELFIPILNSEEAYVTGFSKMNSKDKSDNFVTDEFMGVAKAEDVVYLNPVREIYDYSYIENNNFDKIEKMKVMLYSYRLYMFCYNIVNAGSEYLIPFYRLPNDGNNASYNLTNNEEFEFEIGKAYTIDEFCDILSKEQEAFEEYNSNKVDEDTYYYQEEGETKLHTLEPTSTPTITPTTSPAPTPTATPTPTASPTATPTASPTPTPTTSPTPSAEPKKVIEVTTGDNIEVKAGGEKVEFTDVNPFVDENNRTQMPIRVLGETLGFDVNWDGNDKTAILTAQGTLITVKIGENKILKNGKTIQMDTTAKVINDRTYIPLRSIAEAVGYTVEWK